MNSPTEQRVKARLKQISYKTQIPFNSLLDNLFLERFLVRVGKSKYSQNLIFKGGMCLSYILPLGRQTRDIDFLLSNVRSSIAAIQSIMTEIAAIDVSDDIKFGPIEVRELPLNAKKYPGYRISCPGVLGQIRNKITIDIGVGDTVRPRALEIELMGTPNPLFEESICLSAYPPEYIFSEKLEAILSLGEFNSRMKDFFDCYRLIEEGALDVMTLKSAIHETTSKRGTPLTQIPKKSDDFLKKWHAFLRKSGLANIDLDVVIKTINKTVTDAQIG